jgi:hypothetical protein
MRAGPWTEHTLREQTHGFMSLQLPKALIGVNALPCLSRMPMEKQLHFSLALTTIVELNSTVC